MATLNLQRFTSVGTLRAIHPELITQLLAPYLAFLKGRGVAFSPSKSVDLDYKGLADVFMHPDDDTPHNLAEALFYINEMSPPDGIERLLDEAAKEKVALNQSPDATPEDIAIQLWLVAPGLVERKHAEQFLTKSKSFDYFQAATPPRPLGDITTQTMLQALEDDLDDWLAENGRGRTSKVFVYPKADETWFLVRHGARYKREVGIKDGESTSVFYRPEDFDVVVYNHHLGEMRLHAETKGLKTLYRQQFGRHLFGDEDLFLDQDSAKYTLEPLRSKGELALVCSDVEGLEWVRLRELQFNWGGPFHEVEIRRASDLLAALAAKDRPIHAHARMVSAKFQIKFNNAKKPRMLTLRPPITASLPGMAIACLVNSGWPTEALFWISQCCRLSQYSQPPTRPAMPIRTLPWTKLGMPAGWAGTRPSLQAYFGTSWPSVAGAFLPTQTLALSIDCPRPGGPGCPRQVVEHGFHDLVAVCGNSPHECDPLPVLRQDLIIHKLMIDPLLADLNRLLHIQGAAPEQILRLTWNLGSYATPGRAAQAVFLCLEGEACELRVKIMTLLDQRGPSFVLLIPSRQLCPASLMLLLQNSGIALAALDELAADLGGAAPPSFLPGTMQGELSKKSWTQKTISDGSKIFGAFASREKLTQSSNLWG